MSWSNIPKFPLLPCGHIYPTLYLRTLHRFGDFFHDICGDVEVNWGQNIFIVKNASTDGGVESECLHTRTSNTNYSVLLFVAVRKSSHPFSWPVTHITASCSFPWSITQTEIFLVCSSISCHWTVGCCQRFVAFVSLVNATNSPWTQSSIRSWI